MLTGKGVTAWQRALASLAVPQAPSGRPPGAAPAHLPALPAPAAAELISALAAVSTGTIKIWHHAGLLTGHPYNDKGQCLYPRPAPTPQPAHKDENSAADAPPLPLTTRNPARKCQTPPLPSPPGQHQNTTHRPREVQYATRGFIRGA